MLRLIMATAATIALTGALTGGWAAAADLPTKAPPSVAGCDAAKFQGGYLGVSGGGVNYTANRTDQDAFVNTEASYVQKKSGGIVGGQIGYNWTTCRTLWGIELDGSWTGAKATTHFDDNHDGDNPGVPGAEFINSRLGALVTGRIRSGLVLDNLLLYVTGGFAAARIKTTWADLSPSENAPFAEQVTLQEWRWGWTAGFGTEWAWTDHWSFKSEVLYVDVPDRTHHVVFPHFGGADFQHSDSALIARVGLNYRFGGR